jgi:predicted small lipoprotein YifL
MKKSAITTALVCLFLASACGQKGPLYLEKDLKDGQAAPTSEQATNQTIEKTETTK